MSTETKETNQNLINRLFSAGAHFGFSKSRRHPTMKSYLFGSKLGTDIFDLEKTVALLEEAKEVLHKAGADGKTVVFVGTKEEISNIVKTKTAEIGAPFVVNRWIGGMITNFSEIKKRIERLKVLTQEGESGELERKYTKKERVVIGREIDKLNNNFGGIKTLEKIPQILVVVDPKHDHIAVAEANELHIPVVAIMSSDNDASLVTHPVVVNDSLQASVTLVLNELADAYVSGKETYVPKPTRAESRPRRTYERRPATPRA